MRKITDDKRLDYFPLIAFFLFWSLSAAAGAAAIRDPALIKLGILTLPALAAVAYCAYKIHRSHGTDREE